MRDTEQVEHRVIMGIGEELGTQVGRECRAMEGESVQVVDLGAGDDLAAMRPRESNTTLFFELHGEEDYGRWVTKVRGQRFNVQELLTEVFSGEHPPFGVVLNSCFSGKIQSKGGLQAIEEPTAGMSPVRRARDLSRCVPVYSSIDNRPSPSLDVLRCAEQLKNQSITEAIASDPTLWLSRPCSVCYFDPSDFRRAEAKVKFKIMPDILKAKNMEELKDRLERSINGFVKKIQPTAEDFQFSRPEAAKGFIVEYLESLTTARTHSERARKDTTMLLEAVVAEDSVLLKELSEGSRNKLVSFIINNGASVLYNEQDENKQLKILEDIVNVVQYQGNPKAQIRMLFEECADETIANNLIESIKKVSSRQDKVGMFEGMLSGLDDAAAVMMLEEGEKQALREKILKPLEKLRRHSHDVEVGVGEEQQRVAKVEAEVPLEEVQKRAKEIVTEQQRTSGLRRTRSASVVSPTGKLVNRGRG